MKFNTTKSILAFPSLLLILALAIPGCGLGSNRIAPPTITPITPISPLPDSSTIFSESPTEPGRIRLPPSGVYISVGAKGTIDKQVYLPGEKVKISFLVVNQSVSYLVIDAFKPQITISRYNMPGEAGSSKLFTTGSQQTVIPPNTKATWEIIWDQKYDNGRNAKPGWYDVNYMYSTKAGAGLIGRFLITFPAGQAMNKVIEANQSTTVKGLPLRLKEGKQTDITMTLERVELTGDGIKVSVLASSPDYSVLSWYKTSPDAEMASVSPEWMLTPVAEYTIDGVTKLAGPGGSLPEAEGIMLTWGSGTYNPLDPVSKDAKELIFTITKYGDWQGPWRFNVPLNR